MKSTSATPRRLQLAAALALSAFAPSTGSAVDFFFNVPNGDWNAAGSWTPAGPPGGGGGNFAYVNNGGTATIAANTPNIQDPFIGRGVGNSGTVAQSGGLHSNVGWAFIGDGGGTGTWNVTGSGSLNTGRIYLGGSRSDAGQPVGGSGSMLIDTTGTVTASSDYSVGTRGGTGNVVMNAGVLNANTWFIVGETQNGQGGSSGTFTQNGGTVNAGATDAGARFWLGSQEGGAGASSSGTYVMNAGNFNARNIIVGRTYTGAFTQNGGIATISNPANDSRLGEAAGAVGTYNLSSGTLVMNANFQIGASGIGTFSQSGGTVNAANFPVVGRFVGGVGALLISGGDFNQTIAANALIIGEEGAGTVSISGGAINAAGNLNLGALATGSGIVNQAGGSVAVTNVLDIQGAGTGSYTLDGGTLSVNGSIEATNGTFTFTGGALTRSNAGLITYLGNLVVGQNDATLKLDSDKTFTVSGLFDVTTGVTFDLSGQTLPSIGLSVQSGSIPLGTDGSIAGLFDPTTTSILGLGNPAGATFISELAGESMSFDPFNNSVYWVQENAGNVTLNYSIVPEPSALLSLLGGIATLAGLQRRRRS